MSDDDAALDSMDTEEEIFCPRTRSLESNVRRSKSLRKLRSHSGSTSHINNLSVRRSTRNRMQTYDNLNTSWILGIWISVLFCTHIKKHFICLYVFDNNSYI